MEINLSDFHFLRPAWLLLALGPAFALFALFGANAESLGTAAAVSGKVRSQSG